MDYPIVSVCILSYNSAKTIIETLNSILCQSYPLIELIISDDCSTDETVNISKQWLSEYDNRFKRSLILESDTNTGVTANCNRAISDIKGKYLKLLAADDLLVPDALTEYVNYMSFNPQSIYVFSKVQVFGNNIDIIKRFSDIIFDYSFFQLPPKDQYKWLICNQTQPIPAASCFINAELAASKGVLYYDERIPMLEDWPKWIELSEKGIAFCFIDKTLAKYRVSETSICSSEQYLSVFNQSRALLYIYYQFKPTKELGGVIRAVALYIRNKAVISNNPLWAVMAFIIKAIFYIRDSLRGITHLI